MPNTDCAAALMSAVRNYDPYSTNRQLAELLRASGAIDASPTNARIMINAFATKNYQNEAVIKHALVGHILMREKEDEVALFELPIGHNRVDLCRINGHSVAFEIKTEYDSFNRLDQQLRAYANVFDYVYVVTPCRRHNEMLARIPSGIGLLTYNYREGLFSFSYRKRARRQSPDPSTQIGALSKKSMLSIANQLGLDIPNPIPPNALANELLEWCDNHPGRFNILFKKEIKSLYRNRWSFLEKEYPSLLPLDTQSSFASQLNLSSQLTNLHSQLT